MKVAREGVPLIVWFAAVSAAVAALTWWAGGAWAIVPGVLGLVLTGWCVWFFRDPERTAPDDPSAVISPADGVVCAIGRAPAPIELGLAEGEHFERVCVFMNVFNVHVNRVPCEGTVERVAYTKGRFFNASLDKASVHNERSAVALRTARGERVIFVQIAGLIARRIVCRLGAGQAVRAGERFGLIRFGSRVDVYLPLGSSIGVSLGQRTIAGETVLGRVPARASGGGVAPGARGAEVPIGR